MLGLLFPLTIGFVGSLHCLGMCGPLILAYSLHLRNPEDSCIRIGTPSAGIWREGFFHHAAFHLGRLTTYGILGTLAAGLFHAADLNRLLFKVRADVNLAAGILLVVLGIALLRVLPAPGLLTRVCALPWSLLSKQISSLIASRGLGSKLALGLSAGLLPCCLSWAMIVTAAGTQNPLQGFLTMVFFGVGTLPALLMAGISSSLLSFRTRILAEKVAASFVIAMGLLLVFRGAGIIA